MMLLLDFDVACVDCTGGNKKKKKHTETGLITVLTESTSILSHNVLMVVKTLRSK